MTLSASLHSDQSPDNRVVAVVRKDSIFSILKILLGLMPKTVEKLSFVGDESTVRKLSSLVDVDRSCCWAEIISWRMSRYRIRQRNAAKTSVAS